MNIPLILSPKHPSISAHHLYSAKNATDSFFKSFVHIPAPIVTFISPSRVKLLSLFQFHILIPLFLLTAAVMFYFFSRRENRSAPPKSILSKPPEGRSLSTPKQKKCKMSRYAPPPFSTTFPPPYPLPQPSKIYIKPQRGTHLRLFDEVIEANSTQSNPPKPPKFKKRTPPFSNLCDTIKPNGKLETATLTEANPENQIRQLPLSQGHNEDSHGLTKDGRHVLQQQALKSCTATAVAMLLLDRNKAEGSSCIKMMKQSNSENEDFALQLLTEAGCQAKSKELTSSKNKLSTLQKACTVYDSILLAIDHPQLRGHTVVLDGFDNQSATAIIRDPYHGESFKIRIKELSSWNPEFFIYIKKFS